MKNRRFGRSGAVCMVVVALALGVTACSREDAQALVETASELGG